ncbi:Uncharacterised protein [Mycobacteroides abscessus subsp. massiliense]|nr:Uncharacterised protein [Mycobacteroides abscessus subsp. massiliense]
MAYQVLTDHQIIGANELMVLMDSGTLEQIVVATRVSGWWTIHAEGIDDVQVDNRAEAVDKMIDHAYNALGPNTNDSYPGDGYSTMVPTGLRELP